MTKKRNPVELLQDALSVLSRAETEKAWAVGNAATTSLGSARIALRAEVAAYNTGHKFVVLEGQKASIE